MAIQNQRTITSPGVWGKDAQTTIPAPPIPGVAYRNPTLTTADFEAGQGYSSRADSATWNEWQYRSSSMVNEIERWGLLPYSPLTNYINGAFCLGDGVVYQALQPNGPGTDIGAVQPGNEAVWRIVYNPAETFLKLKNTDIKSVTIYIDAAKGKDEVGAGLSPDTPFKTFTYALLYGSNNWLCTVYRLTYSLADGDYSLNFSNNTNDGRAHYWTGIYKGPDDTFVIGGSNANIRGGVSIFKNAVQFYNINFHGSSQDASFNALLGYARVANCSFTGYQGYQTGVIRIFDVARVYATSCSFFANNNYACIQAYHGGQLYMDGNNSCNGSVSTGCFVGFAHASVTTALNVTTMTGTLTGPRYFLSGLSYASTGSPTFFPGTQAGAIFENSVYV